MKSGSFRQYRSEIPAPEPAAVRSSCSWCHELNAVGRRFCAACGHSAHLPRLHCECPDCQHGRRLVEIGHAIDALQAQLDAYREARRRPQ